MTPEHLQNASSPTPVSRRRFIVGSATALSAGVLGLAPSSQAAIVIGAEMDALVATLRDRGDSAREDRFDPFRVDISQATLDDLRRRIEATPWQQLQPGADSAQQRQLETLRALAVYWSGDYDWRACEARLNGLAQFITRIDGADIHYIHVRSRHPAALPLVIAHGWPDSIVGQMKMVDSLVNPTAYGAPASDAFHVVIPSLPGSGFSAAPSAPAWGPRRMGRACAELMQRLGYACYGAQGVDWGAMVVNEMALQAPQGLLAVHTNLPASVTAVQGAFRGSAPNSPRIHTEKPATCHAFMASGSPGLQGASDSPVWLAASLLGHWSVHAQPSVEVPPELRWAGVAASGLRRDEFLDDVTLHWVTNTGASAFRPCFEHVKHCALAKGLTIPVAASAFPGTHDSAPLGSRRRTGADPVACSRADESEGAAAWERPRRLAVEVRAGFRPLR